MGQPKRQNAPLGGLRLLALQISKSTMRRETTGVITVFVALLLVCGLSTELEMHEGETFTSSFLASHYTSCSNAIANVRVTLEGDGAKSGKLVHDQLEDIARACLAGTTIQLGEASQAEHGAGPVLNYQVQLRTEQRKCPNSDLVCPPIRAGPTQKLVSNKPMVLQHPKDFENCVSEGGTWNCARCREADGTGGALPCDGRSYSQCPDDLHAVRFFDQGGGCISFGRAMFYTKTVRNGHFPYEGNKWNKWKNRDHYDGFPVSTKYDVGHAQYSHPTEGYIMFKRVVFHKSGNTTKADVYKVGYCIRCPLIPFKKFRDPFRHSHDKHRLQNAWGINCKWGCYLKRYADLRRAFRGKASWLSKHRAARSHYYHSGIKEGRDCSCKRAGNRAIKDRRKRAIKYGVLSKDRRKRAVFHNGQSYHATNDEKSVFVKECVKNAFGRNRRLKKSYECGDSSRNSRFGKVLGVF